MKAAIQLLPTWFATTPAGMYFETEKRIQVSAESKLEAGVYWLKKPYTTTSFVKNHSSRNTAALHYRDSLFDVVQLLKSYDYDVQLLQSHGKFMLFVNSIPYTNPSYKVTPSGIVVWTVTDGFITNANLYTQERVVPARTMIDVLGNTSPLVRQIKMCLPEDAHHYSNGLIVVKQTSDTITVAIPQVTVMFKNIPVDDVLNCKQYRVEAAAYAEIAPGFVIAPNNQMFKEEHPVMSLQTDLLA